MLIKWSSSIYYRDSPLYYPNSTYTMGRYSCTYFTLKDYWKQPVTLRKPKSRSLQAMSIATTMIRVAPSPSVLHHSPPISTFLLLSVWLVFCEPLLRQTIFLTAAPATKPGNLWLQVYSNKSGETLLKAAGPSVMPPAKCYLQEGTQSKSWRLYCCRSCSKAFAPALLPELLVNCRWQRRVRSSARPRSPAPWFGEALGRRLRRDALRRAEPGLTAGTGPRGTPRRPAARQSRGAAPPSPPLHSAGFRTPLRTPPLPSPALPAPPRLNTYRPAPLRSAPRRPRPRRGPVPAAPRRSAPLRSAPLQQQQLRASGCCARACSADPRRGSGARLGETRGM